MINMKGLIIGTGITMLVTGVAGTIAYIRDCNRTIDDAIDSMQKTNDLLDEEIEKLKKRYVPDEN